MKTVVAIKATGSSVFCFEQDGYDIDVLGRQSGFICLTQRQKEQCEECYRELTPYRINSVLASGQAAKQIGAYNFVNDAGKISEAIIIILYMLRCCLAALPMVTYHLTSQQMKCINMPMKCSAHR